MAHPDDFNDKPGTWWRCEEHGLTDSVIWVSGWRNAHAYCPAGDCDQSVELVKGAIRDIKLPGAKTWRKTKGAVQ